MPLLARCIDIARMGRTLRDHAPRVAFHITARTLGHWFNERNAADAERIMIDGVASSDALLLAHVVMPNHFHLVLRSGERTLGWVMQPIMRRLALLVNRARARHGPVFEGRFRSHACDDADHLRRAIVYVHNNPLRKDLCTDPSRYAWHSHQWYTGGTTLDGYAGAAVGLQLFVNSPATSTTLGQNYLDYFAWRVEKDRCDHFAIPCAAREPEAYGGDAYFREHFRTRLPNGTVPRPDLRDAAELLLARIEPGSDLNLLRRPYVSRDASTLRRQLMCALLQRGYGVGKIASMFRISGSVVSQCASHLRNAKIDLKLLD